MYSENSWRWTEELSETCRVSCKNKFVKLVHLLRGWFYYKESWLKRCLGFPVFEEILLISVEYPFHFHRKIHNRDIKHIKNIYMYKYFRMPHSPCHPRFLEKTPYFYSLVFCLLHAVNARQNACRAQFDNTATSQHKYIWCLQTAIG